MYQPQLQIAVVIELITVDGKKEFRKYSCLTLSKRMLLWSLVVRVDKTLGIREVRGCLLFFKFKKQAQFSVPSP